MLGAHGPDEVALGQGVAVFLAADERTVERFGDLGDQHGGEQAAGREHAEVADVVAGEELGVLALTSSTRFSGTMLKMTPRSCSLSASLT